MNFIPNDTGYVDLLSYICMHGSTTMRSRIIKKFLQGLSRPQSLSFINVIREKL